MSNTLDSYNQMYPGIGKLWTRYYETHPIHGQSSFDTWVQSRLDVAGWERMIVLWKFEFWKPPKGKWYNLYDYLGALNELGKTTTTFGDLVSRYSWDDVRPVLFRLYPGQEKNEQGYKEVVQELRSTEPQPSLFHIRVAEAEDILGTPYTDVIGIDSTEQAEPGKETHWSLEFNSWAEWLGIEIEPDSLVQYDEITILAHCLHDMTFHGYSNADVQAVAKEMNDSLDETLDELGLTRDDLTTHPLPGERDKKQETQE